MKKPKYKPDVDLKAVLNQCDKLCKQAKKVELQGGNPNNLLHQVNTELRKAIVSMIEKHPE